ncbi:TIGR04438 family Trp-rich protein [Mitsuaria sp. GD03876]|uniref:TIGR04438 family Trp-rich protein n=1 Tax=Mitsuaria sp. GD03876 TaxID=2975399 RepID=UPI00244D1642|nr:TIGR04438 family Trp-rich protein [Mitsuaria sp. GD03876]MDH0865962.1 TIGR04438 family Trp-rich protein [Mitsuaria sp. GD03876]
MWFVVIAVLLILLKLIEFGPIADLSWWWVLSPLVLAILWWEFADKSGYTKRKEMDKMDARKEARRQRSLEALGQGEKQRKR